MSRRERRPVSTISGANYSNFFHSGLRAVSSHVRSMSAPVFSDSVQSSLAASSLRPPLQTSFRRHGQRPIEDAASGVPLVSESDLSSASMAEESTPEDGNINVLMVKGVPLRLKVPRSSKDDKGMASSSELVSLDPLAPSPCPTASSFFIELSEASSSTDSSPSFLQKDQDESFLYLSTSPAVVHPYARGMTLPIQTMSLSSPGSTSHLPVESAGDTSWLYGLDTESPEFNHSRRDALPKFAVDAPIYSHDGVDDDWRQFHADFLRDDETPFSLPNNSLL